MNWVTRALIGVVILFLTSISVQNELVHAGINWTEEYTADLLPQDSTPSWRRIIDTDECIRGKELVENLENGILTIFRRNDEIFYVRDDVLEAPFTVELSMKVNYNNYQPAIRRVASLYFGAIGLDARVDFYPDNVAINTSLVGMSHLMDTADTFHTYRFTYFYEPGGRQGVLRFYVDQVFIGELDHIRRPDSGLYGPWG